MANIDMKAEVTRRTANHSPGGNTPELAIGHYLQVVWHRKWLVLSVFALVAVGTFGWAYRLPNVYESETLILVDPQKVPDNYVKATVTGDVRDRLGTLSQQILSATRLQKIIDSFNLYPQERKSMPREDVILEMRSHISVNVLSEFGGSQDLQAFRIKFSGSEPRLVAQVTNELASLFIEENLKAREQQAQGTSDFLGNQLSETRKALEQQESKLRDFKLKHLGEMPEQQSADLQILGQLQSQSQTENDALSRAQQQKSYLQSMITAPSAPVIDLDDQTINSRQDSQRGQSQLSVLEAKLAQLLTHYSDQYPDVQKVKRQIEEEKRKEAAMAASTAPPIDHPIEKPRPASHFNPVLQSQLETIEIEIQKHKTELQRLSKLISVYQSRLEAIPVREQEVTELVRDYEISKTHYSQLLEKQLSAETATQLEIRQKGEKFSILDPAEPAQRPSKPNRQLLDSAGAAAGLALGLLLAMLPEFLGTSITSAEQIKSLSGLTVLEVIPMIEASKNSFGLFKSKKLLAAISATAAVMLVCVVYILRMSPH